MADGYLIDTDVAIDFLRGRPEAKHFLDGLTPPLMLSVVTVAELYAGVKDGRERTELGAFVQGFEVVPLSVSTAVQGGLYRRAFAKSHGVGLIDTLIAATADQEKATLITLNKKHFPMLTAVIVPYHKS